MRTVHTDLAIAGAGIVGLAHAYVAAAKARQRVTVYEKNPAAMGASIRNFGMIWPIGQPAGVMHETAMRSREIWLELLEEARLPCHLTGSLHAAYREDEAAVGREFAERGRALGYECEWLNAAQTMAKTSAIRSEGLLGALWSETELTVDAPQVMARIPEFLKERYGVRFHFNTPLTDTDALDADAIIVASGDDFQTLFPRQFAAQELTRCKLQMLRTEAQPEGWALGPSLAFGLTFRHYPTFCICESLAALKARVAEETPELDEWGIHVMASENSARQIVLGDSHEYGLKVNIFDRSHVNELILAYAQKYLRVPNLKIAETWHGVYAKHKDKPFLRLAPRENLRIVTVTSGVGMTLAFGLAEQTLRDLDVLS
jgi:FAD dependent oxidoreductase TIGR03364